MGDQQIDIQNVQFMLGSLRILLECGETQHAIELIDAYTHALENESAELLTEIE